jgi:hypothetical protein
MSRMKRNDDWGFPRWRHYGVEKEPVKVRTCDHAGCSQPGEYRAPKAPNSDEKWFFCLDHVTEYNKGWDYFAGLSPEEAYERARAEERMNSYQKSGHWNWGAEGDPDGTTRAERAAFKTLGLETSASAEEIKAAYRALAKQFHPDRNAGDPNAVPKFQSIQQAYEILSARAPTAQNK